jgi:uncharacterized protein YlaI
MANGCCNFDTRIETRTKKCTKTRIKMYISLPCHERIKKQTRTKILRSSGFLLVVFLQTLDELSYVKYPAFYLYKVTFIFDLFG